MHSSLLGLCSKPHHNGLFQRCTILHSVSPCFPVIQFSINIFSTSSFGSSVFFIDQVGLTAMAGSTTELKVFPFVLSYIRFSHSIPDTLFQFIHPGLIHIYLHIRLVPVTKEPKYLFFLLSPVSPRVALSLLLCRLYQTTDIPFSFY